MIKSADEFYALRKSSVQAEYYRAAHDSATLEVWQDCLKRFPEMNFWVAQNKTVPLEILEILAHNSDPEVRSMVASKRKLPETLQKVLALDKDFSVKMSLVRNAKVTSKVLQLLVKDEDMKIREAARKALQKS